jgi:hemolysin D
MYAQQLANLDADVARRMAEISIARSQSLNQVDTMQFDAGVDGTTQTLERAVLAANLARLRANLRLLDAKGRETKVLKRWVGVTLGQQAGLANVLQDQLELRPAALGDVNEAKAPALETESNLSNILITMPKLQEELSRENTTIDSIRSQKEDTIERFIADDVEAVLAAQVKRGDIVQNLVRATARDGNMRLTAPVAGTVVELTATKVGQVVVVGQLLAKIVPDGAPIEAEAWLANRDIAFVQQGQKVLLKIDAFPFARYGTLTGRVSFVARDAVSAQEALVQTGVSAALVSHGLSTPIASQVQDTVYSITIALDKSAVAVDGSLVPLIPGMSAVIEIKTGQRRVIDYLLSPIAGLFSDAAHER